MPIRFCGVDLCVDDPEGVVQDFLDQHLSVSDLVDIAALPVYSHTSRPEGMPIPNYTRREKVRLNSLYWPTGATRWGVGHFLATTRQKEEILKELNWRTSASTTLSDAIPARTGRLELGEPGDKGARIFTRMFMLPPRPITPRNVVESVRYRQGYYSQNGLDREGNPPPGMSGHEKVMQTSAIDGLWLLPLVDVRYWWQFYAVPEHWVADNWENTIDFLASVLHIKINHKGINSDSKTAPTDFPFVGNGEVPGTGTYYGSPDSTFGKKTQFHNAAHLLDGVAHCCMTRLVHNWTDMNEEADTVHPNNTTTSTAPQDGSGEQQFNFNLIDAQRSKIVLSENYGRISENMPSHLIGETKNRLGPTHPGIIDFHGAMIAGDSFGDSFGGGACPEKCSVIFRRCNGGRYDDPMVYFKKTFLAEDTCVEQNTVTRLFSPDYVIKGTEKIFRTLAVAKFADEAAAVPINYEAVDGLSESIAREYFKSLQRRHDHKFGGVQFWQETLYDDFVEYTFGSRNDGVSRDYECETRVSSVPYNFGVEEMFHYLGGCGEPTAGTPMNQSCCKGCAPGGSVASTECRPGGANICPDGMPKKWTFVIDPFLQSGGSSDDVACCNKAQGAQILEWDSGCGYVGQMELDDCRDVGGDAPRWELVIGGTDPYGVTLSLSLDTTGDGNADAEIVYKNQFRWCCTCANPMRLYCPTNLPDFCQDWPCDICVGPGVNCCSIGGTVTATMHDQQSCGCANAPGTPPIVMTYMPALNLYEGVGLFCGGTGQQGHLLKLQLICTVADSAGTSSCDDYKLKWEWLDNCGTNGEMEPSDAPPCSCDPLSLTFEGISGIDSCCNNTGPGTTPNSSITITIG